MSRHPIKMYAWSEIRPEDRTKNKAVSLYPHHIAAIEAFAKQERRTFSNAVQVIIEQWFDRNFEDLVIDKEHDA